VAILGIDCSSNNGQVNWALAAQRGVQFAFYRKNLCLWQDRLFSVNSPGLLDHIPMPCLYTVWSPFHDRKAQFDTFIKDLWPAQWYRIAVDVERPSQGVNNKKVLGDLLWLLEALSDWHGRKPLIYTNRYYWNRYYSTKPGWGDEWELWVANYQRATPAIPVGWEHCTIWQYSADGNKLGPYYGGKSTSMDLNTAQDWFVA
jgi:GH25 family lysozyme M1 (1,4-beta-N-acetylmuramidase)